MANYLTDARRALLEALKADAQIAARVKTWFEFGPGLRRRYNVEPAACPLLALCPVDGAATRTANVLTDVVQRLRVEVATDGQDAGPCEELVALVLERIIACDESCLGLSDSGLAGIEVEAVRWRSVPNPAGGRIAWAAGIDLSLLWKRA